MSVLDRGTSRKGPALSTVRPPRGGTGTKRRRPPVGILLAFAVFAVLVVVSLVPDLVSGDPLDGNPAQAFQPPSGEHLLGTDQLGRDLYSRLVHGAFASLSLGIGATLIGLFGGALLGVAAGYARGTVDRIITRLLDVLLAFPEVLVALLAITVLGPGQWSLVLAVGLGRIPGAARLVRAQVQQVRSAPFVAQSIGLGLTPAQILQRHIVPNSLGPVLVHTVLGVGVCIIFGAGLSFLGLGAVPPSPEWGLMLSEARQYLSVAPWLAIWPGLAITAAVVSVTLSGRWLQQEYLTRRSVT